MQKTIALVTCVKEKQNEACAAKDLYKGALFAQWMGHANKHADEVYILSGKHHVLQLDQIIEPYDLNLDDATTEEQMKWSHQVIQQIKSLCDMDQCHFIVMTTPVYYQYLLPEMKSYEIPFKII